MILVGIDPGHRNLGLARLEVADHRIVAATTQTLSIPKATRIEEYAHLLRPTLLELFTGALHIGAEAFPEVFSRRPRDGHPQPVATWTRIGTVVGIWTAVAEELKVSWSAVLPLVLKRLATANYKAEKADMIAAARSAWPAFQGTDHEADALLAALACGAQEVLLGPGFYRQ